MQRTASENPYKILKVDQSAPLEVIKAAYRALLKSQNAHPDLGGTEEGAREVIEAYAVLSDPEKRGNLDRELSMTSSRFQQREDVLGARSQQKQEDVQFMNRSSTQTPGDYYVICLRCRGLNRLQDSQAIFYAKCGGCLQPFLNQTDSAYQAPSEAAQPAKRRMKPDEKLAQHLFERGMFLRALDDFRRLAEMEPDKFRHHYMCGLCYYKMLQFKNAVKGFSAAVFKSPGDFMSNYYLSKSLLKIENRSDALIYLKKALEINPKHLKAQCMMGNTLASLGNYTEAVRHLLPAAKIRPNAHHVLYNLSLSFFNLGKLVHARIYSKQAKRIAPNTPGLNELILKIEGNIRIKTKHAL